MNNEKGATLVQVLLVILIFSILGISLISGVVGEKKRVVKTETSIHARNLARDGLTYFEVDFQRHVEKGNDIGESIAEFLKKYESGLKVPVKGEGEAQEIMVSAKVLADEIKITEADGPTMVDTFQIEVTSQAIIGGVSSDPLKGYYRLKFKRPMELLEFDANALALDFSKSLLKLDLLDLNVLKNLIDVSELPLVGPPLAILVQPIVDQVLDLLITLLGTILPEKIIEVELGSYADDNGGFYPVPDDKIAGGEILRVGELDIGLIDLENENAFTTVENNEVIAVRNSGLLKADALGITNVSLLDFSHHDDLTNVLINGEYARLEVDSDKLIPTLRGIVNEIIAENSLLGFLLNKIFDLLEPVDAVLNIVDTIVNKLVSTLEGILGEQNQERQGYKNIDFLKLAVTGETLIKQEPNDPGEADGRRTFSFKNGLFVNRSLYIGGLKNKTITENSRLMLNGDMVTMADLFIAHTDFETDHANLYVHGNAEIQNSCINREEKNHDFRLFVKGKLDILNHPLCKNVNGLLYAEGEGQDDSTEGDITINTNGHDMTIHGGVIGEVSVTGTGTVTIIPDAGYLEQVSIRNTELVPLGRTFD